MTSSSNETCLPRVQMEIDRTWRCINSLHNLRTVQKKNGRFRSDQDNLNGERKIRQKYMPTSWSGKDA